MSRYGVNSALIFGVKLNLTYFGNYVILPIGGPRDKRSCFIVRLVSDISGCKCGAIDQRVGIGKPTHSRVATLPATFCGRVGGNVLIVLRWDL